MDPHPDLERGDQNKSDSTQSIRAQVSEERIQAESLQATVPNNSDNDNSTSIPGGAPGSVALYTDLVPATGHNCDKREWMRLMRALGKDIPALVNISPRLDENNLLDGRPVFLSPNHLGLSKPSHGIAVLFSLMVQSMFWSAVGGPICQFVHSHRRTNYKRTCFTN